MTQTTLEGVNTQLKSYMQNTDRRVNTLETSVDGLTKSSITKGNLMTAVGIVCTLIGILMVQGWSLQKNMNDVQVTLIEKVGDLNGRVKTTESNFTTILNQIEPIPNK